MLAFIGQVIWWFKIPLLLAFLIWLGAVNGTFGHELSTWLLANPGNILVPAFILWVLLKIGAAFASGDE